MYRLWSQICVRIKSIFKFYIEILSQENNKYYKFIYDLNNKYFLLLRGKTKKKSYWSTQREISNQFILDTLISNFHLKWYVELFLGRGNQDIYGRVFINAFILYLCVACVNMLINYMKLKVFNVLEI